MKISIVTPSFNQGRFIERTLQSVLNQQSDELEYKVMDGGSQDETVAILKKYAERLEYESAKDNGQAHAINKGFRTISGEIIGWLNSDDVYYPEAFKKVIAIFKAHPEVGVVYGDAYHIDEHDQIIERYPTEKWNAKRLHSTCFLAQPAVFMRRQLLDQYGLLNEDLHFCLDYEYWLRLAGQGVRFYYLNEVLAGSRLYSQTKTMSFPLKATREALDMLKVRIGYVPTQWLVNYAVLLVKNKKTAKIKRLPYFAMVLTATVKVNFVCNGFIRGLFTLLCLPGFVFKRSELLRTKRKVD